MRAIMRARSSVTMSVPTWNVRVGWTPEGHLSVRR
jgi:hypothetical protein